MSDFKLGPVPTGLQSGLSNFLMNVKKRIDILGGITNDSLISKQDLIDLGLITTAGKNPDDGTEDRTIFVLTPTTPYKVGDLWVQEDGLYRCQTVRLTGTYNSDDWVPYADQTADNSQEWDWIAGDKPDIDADNTQSALNLGAAIDNAIANGSTFMQGGYINTDIVKVNSTLIVGDVDWSTQVGGAGKPDDNADVTGSNTANNTSNVGSYAAAVYNNWVTGGTLINGGYIQTNTISLNRIIGNDGNSVTFSNSTGMVFADGADLELQSTQDSTSMLIFTRGGYTYDIRSLSSGSYLYIAGRTSGSGIQIGDGSYTRYVNLRPTYSGDLIAGSLSGTHYGFIADNSGSNAYIQAFTTSSQGVNYVYTQTYFRPSPNGGAGYPSLGGSGANTWGALYCNALYNCITDSTSTTSSTVAASATAVKSAYDLANHSHPYASSSHNHSGETLNINLSGATTVSGNFDATAANTYQIGATNRFLGIYSQGCSITYGNLTYALIGGASYNSTLRLRIKGIGTTPANSSIYCEDSSSSYTFFINDAGSGAMTGTLTQLSATEAKQDIVDLNELNEPIIPKLLSLSGKEYNLKREGDRTKRTAGFLYEDVVDILPNVTTRHVLVHDGKDENGIQVEEPREEVIKGITYSSFAPYFAKGFQEQQGYVDSAANRIEDLEIENISLLNRVELLETLVGNLIKEKL